MAPTVCSAETEKPRPGRTIYNMQIKQRRVVRRLKTRALHRLEPEVAQGSSSNALSYVCPSGGSSGEERVKEGNNFNDVLKLGANHLQHLEEWEKFLATKVNNRKTKGLLDIALRTMKLIHRNKILQQRLAQLQEETQVFVASVMANPENKHLSGEGSPQVP